MRNKKGITGDGCVFRACRTTHLQSAPGLLELRLTSQVFIDCKGKESGRFGWFGWFGFPHFTLWDLYFWDVWAELEGAASPLQNA